jgi:ribosomal protein L29
VSSEHVDFSESTEEVKPLTEEEKKAKLEELRRKLAEKREGLSVEDKEATKKNEVRDCGCIIDRFLDVRTRRFS